jgi:hypothetical protein
MGGVMGDQKELYLLLLHKFGVGTVVDDVRSEDGRCKLAVDFFGADVLQLSIEDELVAFNAEVDGCFLA